ncbi:hypothetical protein [Maribacter sp. 2210JD10-5]|uniref:hypothetical protein n=1 Tax=Maribacter sp. 2210JD10-5 TaxID=3386272 RepID=UPI0039BD37C3
MKMNISSLLTFLIILFLSCNNNDSDPCEGLVLDVIQQTLIIEIIDANGNNLIENGTYAALTIFTERNGFQTIPVVFDKAQLPSVSEELKNVVVVPIFDGNTISHTVNIHLNQDEIDVLTMDIRAESMGCSGTFYEILEIGYNEEKIDFQDIGNNYYKITVVK